MKNKIENIIIRRRRKNSNSGFTLVEALFAVVTLTFTITILMSVVSNSLFSSRYSKDEITASYLMQEIIDYIRNDRDTTVFMNHGSWNDFYSHYEGCQSGAGGCYFAIRGDYVDTPTSCGSDCPFLYFDEGASYGSFYNYKNLNSGGVSNVATNIKRKIIIEKDLENSDEINVQIIVSWKNGSNNIERSLSTTITNWR